MSSRRVLKAAEAIREVVGMAILADLRDPRIEHVTVTRVEVSADLRNAKVYVSVMGSEAKQHLALKGLESSAGFLQSKVAGRIDTRYTPRLTFKLDDGVKKSIAIAKMLADVLPDTAPDAEAEADAAAPSPEESTD
ncbi:Ribosome-binding factor A [Planctomycetes bacterium MalM25]|nr:Ribosome-binding factor A [Planctomycetes bacterium MalM25]